MKKFFPVIAVCLLLAAPSFARSNDRDTTKHPVADERDGSSFDKAVIITDTTEGTGVRAEYDWIAIHYPGYSSTGQALSMHDKHPYDIIYITAKDGTKKEIFFDISRYFGKF